MMVVKNESYLEDREISPGISSHLQVFELAWLYTRTRRNQRKDGEILVVPTSSGYTSWFTYKIKKEMNQNYFRKQQKIRK